MAENTVNSHADEDIERTARNLADDVSLLLDERGIAHETYVEYDGDEGWYVVITAGHEVHGNPLREWTFTYATAEQRWLWQSIDEDGEQEGPHGLPELAADSSPVEIAEYIAANVEELS